MLIDSIDPEHVIESTFVKSAKWLNEIGSTNTYVIENQDSFSELPFILGAESQTGGRGRGSNQWWGGKGGLTFSLVLSPGDLHIPMQHWPLMSLMVGLAIREALINFIDHPLIHLKWPNDVYANEKKICGILIETIPGRREHVIIGIGLNVNNSMSNAPIEIQQRATSVVDLLKQKTSREAVLISILQKLKEIFSRLPGHSQQLLNEWRQHCFLTGKNIAIDESQSQITGQCLGIDNDGALMIKSVKGPEKVLAGTVRILDEC